MSAPHTSTSPAARTMDGPVLFDDLPDDVVVYILSHLMSNPIAAFPRLAPVCKRWHDLLRYRGSTGDIPVCQTWSGTGLTRNHRLLPL